MANLTIVPASETPINELVSDKGSLKFASGSPTGKVYDTAGRYLFDYSMTDLPLSGKVVDRMIDVYELALKRGGQRGRNQIREQFSSLINDMESVV